MVRYTGNTDDGAAHIEPEELGADLPSVEWPDDVEELRRYTISRSAS